MRSVWVVGHRGASGHAPENTLAAFHKAVEQGARFIETDLHLSRDAHFVALHDSALDRTTNGHGAVVEHTLAELRQLDAGSWFAPDFSGERIPTLEEILHFAREADIGLYLEVKPSAAWGTEHALVSVLAQSGLGDRVVILSFDSPTLVAIRRRDPSLVTGLLFEWPYPDMVQRTLDAGARQIVPRGDLVTEGLVKEAAEAGLRVLTWTINEPAQMRHLIAAGVHGIMSDYPDRLVHVLNEHP